MPAKLFMDCGWDRSPVTEPFQNLQSDRVWQAHLQGLQDHSQEGPEPVRSQFRVHSQDWGSYAYYPVHGWAWLLLGPLAYAADDRTKPYVAITESSGEGSSFWVCSPEDRQWVSYLGAVLCSQNVSPQSWTSLGFDVSYPDPKDSTKTLGSLHGCQIIVAGGRTWRGDILFSHVTDVIPASVLFWSHPVGYMSSWF